MKKLFLTFISVFTILYSQAQCQSDFSYMQNGPTAIFTDLSTMQSTNYSVTWDWDFGDGSTSTLQNPTHTYSNGIYFPCLTVTFFDSTIMNSCTSIYCDSILVGNAPPASWDCTPATGCYDPGTGLGQYTSLSACQAVCGTQTPSWDCGPTFLGCYDPGTGLGQYTSLSACQAVCGTQTPSWDCGPAGCYDPGTGLGQYSTLSACQSVCSSTSNSPCDSLTVTGSQYQLVVSSNNLNTFIDYWVTTGNNGTILGEDSMSTNHNVFNYNPSSGLPFDTIVTCITVSLPQLTFTCCVTWIWNGTFWSKLGSVTSIGEIYSTDKKLIRVIDVLGRDPKGAKNEPLFFIYDDGTVEKKLILE